MQRFVALRTIEVDECGGLLLDRRWFVGERRRCRRFGVLRRQYRLSALLSWLRVYRFCLTVG
jgi:hypothetical protein